MVQGQRSGRSPDFSHTALGLVSTRSFPAIIGTADMMLKSAGVTLLGYEKIGSGYCTAVVRGRLADVRIAVESGAETAQQFGQLVSKSVIPRPLPNLDAVLPIGSRLAQISEINGYSRLSNQAVGLLETRGFPAMVGAADAMLKSAEVQLASYEMIGSGLCTAIIRGNVADVTIAIEVGMHEAERIGELHSVMVIPRPLEDLEHTLPVASCWIETPKPLSLPLDLKEKQALPEKELLELPELRELATPEPRELELEPEGLPESQQSQSQGEAN
ncbi:MAG: BMC domain-containing protein [Synechococcales bacterium]|nr:BMC domain-containing protein [Synechococcales bacterium]